ncbi:HIT family protein [Kineococcus sp. TBRC 1896]|uniref:HIT family protein n=1 Tax=Kineococcus mangrovi TaxID=1660183 RepID=A0ABV4I117_9ACTN
MTTSPSCPFCAIVDGTAPRARVLYRDERVVAFFPLDPATRGHTLVVPHRHVPDVRGLSRAEAHDLAEAVQRVAATIWAGVQPQGLNIIQSNGPAATQTVAHLHVHLVPRWDEDRMGLIWPEGAAEDDDAQDRTLLQLQAALPTAESTVTPEDRRQHLTLIQAVITRMSTASSSAKTWSLAVLTLTYGFALNQHAALGALLGVAAVAIFGLLDANYLKNERAFRALYDKVARGDVVEPFALTPALPSSENRRRRDYWPAWQDFRSWAIAPVYGPLLLIGLGLATYLHFTK